jgi:hypothetical protein
MIAIATMMIGAAVGFLTARLIVGTASSVRRSPYMSSRADTYRQRAADAKQRAAQTNDPSIKIAFEYEAAFWFGLADQLDWIGRQEVSPQITFSGLSLETANGDQCRPSEDMLPHSPRTTGIARCPPDSGNVVGSLWVRTTRGIFRAISVEEESANDVP